MDQRFADAFRPHENQVRRLNLAMMLRSTDSELYEAGIDLLRYTTRNATTVLPESLFVDPDERDAYDIFRRQNELDQWHKLNALQSQIDLFFKAQFSAGTANLSDRMAKEDDNKMKNMKDAVDQANQERVGLIVATRKTQQQIASIKMTLEEILVKFKAVESSNEVAKEKLKKYA